MSSPTTAELELEAERTRERLADTASSIRDKLTPGQMIDELTGWFSGGDMSQGLGNLKIQMRDNPLPLTLVGAGIAMLALGVGTRSSGGEPRVPPGTLARDHAGPARPSSSVPGRGGGSDSNLMHDARDAAAGAMAGASNAMGDAGAYLRDTVEQLRHGMLTGASAAGGSARSAASGLREATDHEPLVLAAAGVIVGAVVGALLPATQFEEEQFGNQAAKLRRQAENAVRDGLSKASDIAAETYSAAKAEARDQSSDPLHGETISERVGDVAKAAADTAAAALHKAVRPDTSRT